MNRFPRRVIMITCAVLGLAGMLALPAYSYLNNFTNPQSGNPVENRWSPATMAWNLNPAISSNINGTRSVATVITNSFATWTNAPNTSLQATRGTDSSATDHSDGTQNPLNINLICFVCNDSMLFSSAGTLAATLTLSNNSTGQIVKADILFNTAVQFSTDAASGSTEDLQTVATHEIGHFFGLAHSPVVRAVMFPFASDLRTLSYDDVAVISDLYPGIQTVSTGSISGSVNLSGTAVFGAHVFAESTTSAQAAFPSSIRKSPIGTLTRPDGTYQIKRLPSDTYVVIAEPLDGPLDNSDIEDYSKSFRQTAVQTNFTTRWH